MVSTKAGVSQGIVVRGPRSEIRNNSRGRFLIPQVTHTKHIERDLMASSHSPDSLNPTIDPTSFAIHWEHTQIHGR